LHIDSGGTAVKASYSHGISTYLQPTYFLDGDNLAVIAYAYSCIEGRETPVEKAVALFYAVRDQIKYDPYRIDLTREKFRASVVLSKKFGFCVEKAMLLAATARVVGIPSRLRFADVRNHLTTKRLKEIMKTDIFFFHGYTELFLNDIWVKATPTFNLSLCDRFGIRPLDFDGIHDSIFHEFDRGGNRHMEYIHDHGPFADLPYEELKATFEKHYAIYLREEKTGSYVDFEREAEEEKVTIV